MFFIAQHSGMGSTLHITCVSSLYTLSCLTVRHTLKIKRFFDDFVTNDEFLRIEIPDIESKMKEF